MRMRRRSRSTARTSSIPAARDSPSRSGSSCRSRTQRIGSRLRSTPSGPLAEPGAGLLVAEDARVPARLEHEIEVAAIERVLGPPAVDDAPLLADERNPFAVDTDRHADRTRLDERRPRRVDPPRRARAQHPPPSRRTKETITRLAARTEPGL